MTPRIDILRTGADLGRLVPEWAALADRCPSSTPFNHPGWVLAWWAQREHLGLGLRCFCARTRDGALVGILPLVRYPDGVVRYAGHDLHDSAAGLTESALLPLLWSGAVAQLREAGDCSVLDLPTLAQADADVLRDLGFAHRIYGVDPGARIILPPTSAEYLTMLTVSRRKRMRAERRALERDHGPIGFELIDREDDLPPALDELWALREHSWQERRRYSELAEHARGDAIHEFLERLAATGGPVGVGRLTAGGALAATALLLRAHRRSWYAMCAFRPALGRYGPGRLLLAECVHAAILGGFGVLELGRGVEPYKFTLGAVGYELPNVMVSLSR